MSDNADLEKLKERIIVLETQVNMLVNQRNNSAGTAFFTDLFKGFFVVLGALFWIMVLYVVISNIVSRLGSNSEDMIWYQPLLLFAIVVFVVLIGYLLFSFKKKREYR